MSKRTEILRIQKSRAITGDAPKEKQYKQKAKQLPDINQRDSKLKWRTKAESEASSRREDEDLPV